MLGPRQVQVHASSLSRTGWVIQKEVHMHVESSENLARGSRVLLVVALHIAAIYAIATSLGVVRAPQLIQPLQASIIEATDWFLTAKM